MVAGIMPESEQIRIAGMAVAQSPQPVSPCGLCSRAAECPELLREGKLSSNEAGNSGSHMRDVPV